MPGPSLELCYKRTQTHKGESKRRRGACQGSPRNYTDEEMESGEGRDLQSRPGCPHPCSGAVTLSSYAPHPHALAPLSPAADCPCELSVRSGAAVVHAGSSSAPMDCLPSGARVRWWSPHLPLPPRTRLPWLSKGGSCSVPRVEAAGAKAEAL